MITEQQEPAFTMALLSRPLQDEPLLTFKEAMAHLRISRSTMYRLLASQQVPGHKVGHTWRFYRSELRAAVRDISPKGQEGRAQ